MMVFIHKEFNSQDHVIDEYTTESIAFTCRMWNFNLSHIVHDNPTINGCYVCNLLLSISEEGVNDERRVSFCV